MEKNIWRNQNFSDEFWTFFHSRKKKFHSQVLRDHSNLHHFLLQIFFCIQPKINFCVERKSNFYNNHFNQIDFVRKREKMCCDSIKLRYAKAKQWHLLTIDATFQMCNKYFFFLCVLRFRNCVVISHWILIIEIVNYFSGIK